MTRQTVEIVAPLGTAVHDHIIVGKDGHARLRGPKLMSLDRFVLVGCAVP
jgi:DNA repair protein RadC